MARRRRKVEAKTQPDGHLMTAASPMPRGRAATTQETERTYTNGCPCALMMRWHHASTSSAVPTERARAPLTKKGGSRLTPRPCARKPGNDSSASRWWRAGGAGAHRCVVLGATPAQDRRGRKVPAFWAEREAAPRSTERSGHAQRGTRNESAHQAPNSSGACAHAPYNGAS